MTTHAHIVVVLLENASRNTVLENAYMSALRSQPGCTFLAQAHGVTHPSQPNYIAMVGGDTLGIDSDDSGWVSAPGQDPAEIECLVDLLEAKGVSWKAYVEDLGTADQSLTAQGYPNGAYTPYPTPASGIAGGYGLYARKHVPFFSFPKVANKANVRDLIVDASEFAGDIGNDALPSFSFYVPNLVNYGHNPINGEPQYDPTDELQIRNVVPFLTKFLGDPPGSIPGGFPKNTMIVVTYDESYPVTAPYNVYTLLYSDTLSGGGPSNTQPYNHYSLLRSIEVNFGLDSLGRNDAAATPYWFLEP